MSLTKLVDVIFGWGRSHGTFNEVDVRKTLYRSVKAEIPLASVGASSVNGTATVFNVFTSSNRVRRAYCEVQTSLTAISTNYVRYELHRKTTSTAATSLVGYLSSAASNLTNNMSRSMTLVQTNTTFAPGEKLVYQVTRPAAGDGATGGAAVITVDYEEID